MVGWVWEAAGYHPKTPNIQMAPEDRMGEGQLFAWQHHSRQQQGNGPKIKCNASGVSVNECAQEPEPEGSPLKGWKMSQKAL